MEYLQLAITVICSVAASSGFWAFFQSRRDKKDASKDMLMGLGHDRIIFLGMTYIERGWISKDEFENLSKYLYKPYRALGGNGTAERIMKEVEKLPLKED